MLRLPAAAASGLQRPHPTVRPPPLRPLAHRPPARRHLLRRQHAVPPACVAARGKGLARGAAHVDGVRAGDAGGRGAGGGAAGGGAGGGR